MADADQKFDWGDFAKRAIQPVAIAILAAVVGAVSTYFGTPIRIQVERVDVPVPIQKPAQQQLAADEDFGAPIQTFGWVNDPDQVRAVVAAQQIPDFADTPAGKVAQGDEDVFLWQAVRKVANRGPPWYPNVNQRDVGCCVGCGWKHCVDVLQAVRITQGAVAEWKPVAVEAIYGGSRVEVGGGRISGDGSVGAWAFESVKRYGNLSMESHGSRDLSEFSPARAREWGRVGIPNELEPVAAKSVVKSGAAVRSWADVKRAIGQGYPVAVCSDQGFTMSRDKDGFARTQGQWMHCMAIIGVRNGAREGGFILNSWGDAAHTGGVFPTDMPVAGFWADAATIDRMVRQGDSFAISDVAGFPSRKLDWFVMSPKPIPVTRIVPWAVPFSREWAGRGDFDATETPVALAP